LSVVVPLPENPDLNQLRRQAKELRDAARRGDGAALERLARHYPSAPEGVVRLAVAQLVIARESGYPSWPRLVAAVVAEQDSRRTISLLLDASVAGRVAQMAELVRADPSIGARSLAVAAMLSDVEAVREHLAADPASAVALDAGRGWPPLLYACYSPWPRIESGRAEDLAEVVRLLLAAGASANTNDGGGGGARYRSALRGAVELDYPLVVEVLLDAGAAPDPGQPIGEAAGHHDLRCLRLLLDHGARVASTWALGAAVFHDNPGAARLLLDALAAGGGDAVRAASAALPDAADDASLPLVQVLLEAGADPDAAGGDGVSALRRAVRSGRSETAELLRSRGAAGHETTVDRFLGACLSGDRGAAERLLAEEPGLPERLDDEDRGVICEAAASRPAEVVSLMVELGFPVDQRRFGELPLHAAAYVGNAGAVRVLLAAGAEVDARDERFEGTALGFASVGSGEQAGGAPGDWLTTVRLLIEAGAAREGVWIAGKPPSEQVADLLRGYGIGPGEPAPDQEGDVHAQESEDGEAQRTLGIGTGVMAEIARHLEAASRELDLDLLASLLHPDVRWTGLCTDRGQVLDWYRAVLAEGTTAEVRSVEVDRDAVLIGLDVTRHAEGARPAPAQRLYQAFTVRDAQIVEIRGYGDRRSALTRESEPSGT
jgi:ankyrin repeat protein